MKKHVGKNPVLRSAGRQLKKIEPVNRLLQRLHFEEFGRNNISFGLEITGVCNLSCGFCALSQVERHKKVVPLERVEELLLHVRKVRDQSGIKNSALTMSGFGEAFLIDDFPDYLRAARRILPGTTIQIASNFTCISTEAMEQVVSEKLIDTFTCSLNYADAKVYEKLCGADRLEDVKKSVDDFVRFRKEHKIDNVLNIGMKKYEGLREKEIRAFEKEAANRWGDAVRLYWVDISNWGECVDLGGMVANDEEMQSPCMVVILNNYFVDMDWNVYPCCACFTGDAGTETLRVGRMGENTYDEMKRRLDDIKRIHLKGEWKSIGICSGCNVYTEDCYNIFFRFGGRYF